MDKLYIEKLRNINAILKSPELEEIIRYVTYLKNQNQKAEKQLLRIRELATEYPTITVLCNNYLN